MHISTRLRDTISVLLCCKEASAPVKGAAASPNCSRWLYACALWLALLLIACGRKPATQALYTIGQIAEVDGWRVTVHSFSFLPPDPWYPPTQGQVFCAVEVTLENYSGRIHYVMPEKQMILRDGKGHIYSPDRNAAVVAARSRQWIVPEGELSIGEKAYGAAAYQIPSGSTGVQWVFRTSLLPWTRSVIFVLGEVKREE